MKKLTLIHNVAISDEIDALLQEFDIQYYTRINNVHGQGKDSGNHWGDHIWPGENAITFVIEKTEKIMGLKEHVLKLKEEFKIEGLKAFVSPIDEVW